MKKIHFIGLGTMAAAVAAIPYVVRKRKQRKLEEIEYTYPITPLENANSGHTDFKDKDHLIFCDESQLSRRLIQLDQTINMRDIGGYTGLDGRKTKWGKVIRSEELAHLSDADVKWLEDFGIKHIYDFRDTNKANRTPDKMPTTADYTNLPTLKGMHISSRELDFDQPDAIDNFMRQIYAYQTANKAQEFATILKALAADDTPILYHCTNGKDRTGLMTSLILQICGVPDETIISDYTLTNITYDEAFETLGSIMADELGKDSQPVPKEKIRDFFGVKPAWLQIQLDYIHENYGDVDHYLLDLTDLTQDDLDQIRDVMLEPVDAK